MSLSLYSSLPRSRFLDVTQRSTKRTLRDIQKKAARETKDLRASHRIYTRQTFASMDIERFQSCDQHLYKFMGTEEIVYIRKELNSHRICVEHQKKNKQNGSGSYFRRIYRESSEHNSTNIFPPILL